MEIARIFGGRELCGEVSVSGAKNAALPILAACLLTDEPCILENIPNLSDIRLMISILRNVGASVEYMDTHTLKVCAEDVTSRASYEAVKKMRASVCLMGAFLGRTGHSTVSLPGGCVIGQRPIDLHIKGFKKLGCAVAMHNGYLEVNGERMVGTRIFLGGRYGSTVTGTANVLMAALGASGTTIIESAACEPEITDLCLFLRKQGALITGIGTNTLTVEGGCKLHGCRHRIIGDRIEAGTFICAALMTRGRIAIRGNTPNISSAVYDKFEEIGASVRELDDGTILVDGTKQDLRPTEVITLPYPGFPTDLQAQFCALLSCIDGISIVSERIYPSRFMHVPELNRMGANIMLEESHAIIHGSSSRQLAGAQLMASDLRASAALYLAGLCAKNETLIQRIYHLDRGYEHFEGKLRSLGASIERIKEADAEPDGGNP
ncbi:MAG: UDP-N-acetylglucosamine 1-carboxyvinyltransferase [Puniceicoccales bacterium]|nr:UDP-N-acetylglucosamine 1-carboxyvinyltransferase [Puniceicoccales bacterium]